MKEENYNSTHDSLKAKGYAPEQVLQVKVKLQITKNVS